MDPPAATAEPPAPDADAQAPAPAAEAVDVDARVFADTVVTEGDVAALEKERDVAEAVEKEKATTQMSLKKSTTLNQPSKK